MRDDAIAQDVVEALGERAYADALHRGQVRDRDLLAQGGLGGLQGQDARGVDELRPLRRRLAHLVEHDATKQLDGGVGRPPQKRNEPLGLAEVGGGFRMEDGEDERRLAERLSRHLGLVQPRGELLELVARHDEARIDEERDLGAPGGDGGDGGERGGEVVGGGLQQHALGNATVAADLRRPGAQLAGRDDLLLVALVEPERLLHPQVIAVGERFGEHRGRMLHRFALSRRRASHGIVPVRLPILLALLAGFFSGVAFAWLARVELGRIDAPVVATRPFNVVLGFAGLVYAPVVGYFVAFHGDWTYGYVVPWRHVPSAVDLALVMLAGGTVLLGFAASTHAARARRLNVVAWLGAVPGALAIVAFLWGAGRLAVSATYAQYHGGFGVLPIASSSLGRGVLLMGGVLVLGVGWTVRAVQQGAPRTDRPSLPVDL